MAEAPDGLVPPVSPPPDVEVARLSARIVAEVPAAIAAMAPDLTVRWLNPAFERQYQVLASELVGRPFGETLGAPGSALAEALRLTAATGEARQERDFPFHYVTPAGEARATWWDLSLVPTHDGDGGVDGVMLLSVDVTARYLANRRRDEEVEALRLADRLKDELLSLVSHELRTPIHAILGFGRILEKEIAGPLTAPQRAYLAKLLALADDLGRLVGDILLMGQIRSGTMGLDREAVQLGPLAAEVAASLEGVSGAGGQGIRVDERPGVPACVGDPNRLRQVLTNLMANALAFGPPGRAVVVGVAAAGEGVRVEVRDEGPGIAAADQARLFQPFSQVDMGPTRERRGTGLGLSIARGIVEAHGGRIGVTSAVGHGSTFWFELPGGVT